MVAATVAQITLAKLVFKKQTDLPLHNFSPEMMVSNAEVSLLLLMSSTPKYMYLRDLYPSVNSCNELYTFHNEK